MAIRIKARAGESAEQMMRRFKKMCEKEGLTKDVKRQAYFEKPSERKRRAMRKSLKRVAMMQAIAAGQIPAGRPPMGGRGGPGAKGKAGPGKGRPSGGAR